MSSDSRGWLGMPEHLGLVGPDLITTMMLVSRRRARALQNEDSQKPAPNRQ